MQLVPTGIDLNAALRDATWVLYQGHDENDFMVRISVNRLNLDIYSCVIFTKPIEYSSTLISRAQMCTAKSSDVVTVA